jgi:hypothetical protein
VPAWPRVARNGHAWQMVTLWGYRAARDNLASNDGIRVQMFDPNEARIVPLRALSARVGVPLGGISSRERDSVPAGARSHGHACPCSHGCTRAGASTSTGAQCDRVQLHCALFNCAQWVSLRRPWSSHLVIA